MSYSYGKRWVDYKTIHYYSLYCAVSGIFMLKLVKGDAKNLALLGKIRNRIEQNRIE